MLFQVLCGFEPIFYTTHPNEESKYFALSGGTIREAENYDILRKYTPFPLISESVNYFMFV